MWHSLYQPEQQNCIVLMNSNYLTHRLLVYWAPCNLTESCFACCGCGCGCCCCYWWLLIACNQVWNWHMWSLLIIFACNMDFNSFTATGNWSHWGYNTVSVYSCQDALSAARNCGRRIFCVYVWILMNPSFTSKKLVIGYQQFCIMKVKDVIEYRYKTRA